jgi:hypothetical protein
MVIKLFDLKNEMLRNGETMIDFLSNNFLVNYFDPQLEIARLMLVEERHLCRIDLLSYEAYQSIDYVDVIMKFNQITNPFSMQINDIIVFPTKASVNRFYQQEALRNDKLILDTKALFIDPSRASQKDKARLEQLQKIADKRKNGSKEIKPANLLKTGEVPFVTDGTALTFSPYNSKAMPSLTALTSEIPKPSQL